MPFSFQLEVQFRELADAAIKRVKFKTPEDILLFCRAAEKLISGGTANHLLILDTLEYDEDIHNLQELIDKGYDTYATDDIVKMVNQVSSSRFLGSNYIDVPTSTPTRELSHNNSNEEKQREIKISREDKIFEAKAEFKKIIINQLKSRLNELSSMNKTQRNQYIENQQSKQREPKENKQIMDAAASRPRSLESQTITEIEEEWMFRETQRFSNEAPNSSTASLFSSIFNANQQFSQGNQSSISRRLERGIRQVEEALRRETSSMSGNNERSDDDDSLIAGLFSPADYLYSFHFADPNPRYPIFPARIHMPTSSETQSESSNHPPLERAFDGLSDDERLERAINAAEQMSSIAPSLTMETGTEGWEGRASNLNPPSSQLRELPDLDYAATALLIIVIAGLILHSPESQARLAIFENLVVNNLPPELKDTPLSAEDYFYWHDFLPNYLNFVTHSAFALRERLPLQHQQLEHNRFFRLSTPTPLLMFSNNPSQQRKLNAWEEHALLSYQARGLTEAMLRDANSYKEKFTLNHYLAFDRLVSDDVPINDALQRVSQLSPHEARSALNESPRPGR